MDFRLRLRHNSLRALIQAPPQAQAAVFPGYHDIHTVQHVALGIVRGEVGIPGDLFPGMVITEFLVIHDDGKGRGNHPALVLDTNLPLGKGSKLGLVDSFRPGTIVVFVDLVHQDFDIRVVFGSQLSQFQAVFLGFFNGDGIFFVHKNLYSCGDCCQ